METQPPATWTASHSSFPEGGYDLSSCFGRGTRTAAASRISDHSVLGPRMIPEAAPFCNQDRPDTKAPGRWVVFFCDLLTGIWYQSRVFLSYFPSLFVWGNSFEVVGGYPLHVWRGRMAMGSSPAPVPSGEEPKLREVCFTDERVSFDILPWGG